MKRIVAFMILLVLVVMAASAFAATKTLKDAFSSGSSYDGIDWSTSKTQWRKTTWAKTKGYVGYHYVRSWIGGTSSDPSNAVADSGRKYSSGDNSTSCNYELWLSSDSIPQAYFPTGYAKYGTTR